MSFSHRRLQRPLSMTMKVRISLPCVCPELLYTFIIIHTSSSVDPSIQFTNDTPDITGKILTSQLLEEGCIAGFECQVENGDPLSCELAIFMSLIIGKPSVASLCQTLCELANKRIFLAQPIN